MRTSLATFALAATVLIAGCDSGITTQEMQAAAIERARQELNLPAQAPLEAQVWAGSEWDGETVLCGTVSGQGGGTQVPPQRFAATEDDPIRWLIFENAHSPIVTSKPNKFPEWSRICDQDSLR